MSATPGPVLALSRGQKHHFESLFRLLKDRCVATEDWTPGAVDRAQPSLVVTLTSDWWEADACLRRARQISVPTLLLMDGIVEWFHQWEDPRNGAREGVGLFLSCPADKIACLGRQSARLLSGWGNAGRCEVVGSPRFDAYRTEPVPRAPDVHPRRLLVMTANTPGFTPAQVARVEASLADLRDALGANREWAPVWRVRGGLREKLALEGAEPELESAPLRQALAAVHAVVTTPSTAQLEAFLSGRPTALLDYANRPHYVTAAWRITAREQISETLSSLAEPSPARMRYQEEVLFDALECATPAAPRLERLVEAMIEVGERSRADGTPLAFPARLLPPEEATPPELDAASLYPGNESFTSRDASELQRQLAFARQEAKTWRRRAEIAISLRGAARRIFGRRDA